MAEPQHHPFAPFPIDPTVCDTCGGLAGEHIQSDPVEYRDAIWSVLLRYGARARDVFYGGDVNFRNSHKWNKQPVESAERAAHLAECGIAWDHGANYWPTTMPDMGSFSQFADSFHPATEVDAVTGRISCRCGEVDGEEWVLTGMTVGQLVWLTVHEAGTGADAVRKAGE